MKALCCTLFSCAILFQAPAAEFVERRAPAPLPLLVTAECQMVVVSPKLALTLIPELSDDVKIVTAWPRLQQMVGRGEATLSARLFGKGTTDKAFTVQTIEEVRYATLFDPPQLPESFFETPAPTVRAPESLDVLKHWPAVAAMPLSGQMTGHWRRVSDSTLASVGKEKHGRSGNEKGWKNGAWSG
ncbi:MAG TPA: hypothetical protein VGO11_12035 [Chthoniobacteraceae bacterium]|nr:hypothetical protein [Chthoniobacteraceae bacterium]